MVDLMSLDPSSDPLYREKVDEIKKVLSELKDNEAFFSIDEFGPFAVKMRGGKALQPPDKVRQVPQWQKSKGSLIVTAALELSRNQIIHLYSDRKNSTETCKLIDQLRRQYTSLTILAGNLRARESGPRGELARRAGSSATRGRRRRRGVAGFYFRDGWRDRAQWRSPPPSALRYGVDVDSTPLARAHGLSLVRTLALKFCIGFIRSRAALDVGLASVSPELDHFFLAKRRAGDPWPSGDRAIELAGRWQQHPASNERRYPSDQMVDVCYSSESGHRLSALRSPLCAKRRKQCCRWQRQRHETDYLHFRRLGTRPCCDFFFTVVDG
jgi:hypothetical protein